MGEEKKSEPQESEIDKIKKKLILTTQVLEDHEKRIEKLEKELW